MSGSNFSSTEALRAALAVVGAKTAGEPDSFEDLVAAGSEPGPGEAGRSPGADDDHRVHAAEGDAPRDGEAIAGIEDPSAENIFAAYGFGNDLVFGDDELDYSVLGAGDVATLADDPIEADLAPGFPDERDAASAYITDDDQSVV